MSRGAQDLAVLMSSLSSVASGDETCSLCLMALSQVRSGLRNWEPEEV